jgi:hypothetical protein
MAQAARKTTPRRKAKKVKAPVKWESRLQLQQAGRAMALQLVDEITSHRLIWNGYIPLAPADRIRRLVQLCRRDLSDGFLWALIEVIGMKADHTTTATIRTNDALAARQLREAEEAERKRDAAWKAHQKAQKAGAQ